MDRLQRIRHDVMEGAPSPDDVMALLGFAEIVAAHVDAIDWHDDASSGFELTNIATEVNDLRAEW
jgi:hypothetical protein